MIKKLFYNLVFVAIGILLLQIKFGYSQTNPPISTEIETTGFDLNEFGPVSVISDTILVFLRDTLIQSNDFGQTWLRKPYTSYAPEPSGMGHHNLINRKKTVVMNSKTWATFRNSVFSITVNSGQSWYTFDGISEPNNNPNNTRSILLEETNIGIISNNSWWVKSATTLNFVDFKGSVYTSSINTVDIPFDDFDIIKVKNKSSWTLLTYSDSEATLMKTFDSGATYLELSRFQVSRRSRIDVQYINDEIVWATVMSVKPDARIGYTIISLNFYNSSNGGSEWNLSGILVPHLYDDLNSYHFQSLFLNGDVGLLLLAQLGLNGNTHATTLKLQVTTNRGITWNRISEHETNGYGFASISNEDSGSFAYFSGIHFFHSKIFFRNLGFKIGIPFLGNSEIRLMQSSDVSLTSSVNSNGLSPITEVGYCLSTQPNPTITDLCTPGILNGGLITQTLSDLPNGTKYYVRSYATNSYGTAYGESNTITLSQFQSCGDRINDVDGNIYDTVQIGDQCWMADNLSTSRFNNGPRIPEFGLSDSTRWAGINSGAWSHYGDDSSNRFQYGKLYNYQVIESGFNVCPTNWSVPTAEDWIRLARTVGDNPGISLKSSSGWLRNNGTNESGFNAYPAGRKGGSGTAYTGLQKYARFWSSTQEDDRVYIYRLSFENDDYEMTTNSKQNGFSIRCILTTSSTVDLDEIDELPKSVILHQNYPNPFNPTTQIRFSLPEPQQVSIRVYDVNGRMITELVNNQTYSAGNHQISFDGTGLSTGVYIYNLTTNSGFTMSRKLVLIK